jgi:hypothetical protein
VHDLIKTSEKEDIALATLGNYSVKQVKRKLNQLRATNPAIGLRGCRLLFKFPGNIQNYLQLYIYDIFFLKNLL